MNFAITTSLPALGVVIVFVVLCFLLLTAFASSTNEKKSNKLPTPSIAVEEGILTSSVSKIIHASVDDVWGAVLNYEDYSWSSDIQFAWISKGEKGVPTVGSVGTMTIKLDDFATKTIHLEITHLDHGTKTIAECTTQYPRWLLKTRRVQEVFPVEGHKGLSEYRSWMTYDGIAAYFLMLTAQDELAEMQKQFAKDLKAFVEARKH